MTFLPALLIASVSALYVLSPWLDGLGALVIIGACLAAPTVVFERLSPERAYCRPPTHCDVVFDLQHTLNVISGILFAPICSFMPPTPFPCAHDG